MITIQTRMPTMQTSNPSPLGSTKFESLRHQADKGPVVIPPALIVSDTVMEHPIL
jgi:hypothetical protein